MQRWQRPIDDGTPESFRLIKYELNIIFVPLNWLFSIVVSKQKWLAHFSDEKTNLSFQCRKF